MIRAILPAFRLRTLPLAFSSILIGSITAYIDNPSNWQTLTCALTLLTACFLQILSNIANDYGDGIKGTDTRQIHAQPNGLTKRVTGTNSLPFSVIKNLLIIWTIITLSTGVILITAATNTLSDFFYFLILGILSTISALMYTVGRKAYGYYGLGDASVFIFFGLVGVLGTYYLQTHQISSHVLFPAISVGCFCVAVLNINNLRDIKTDRESGKHTFALYIGEKRAKFYHQILITFAFIGLCTEMRWDYWSSFLFLLSAPFFIMQIRRINLAKRHDTLGRELPACVKLILICCSLFSLGQIL